MCAVKWWLQDLEIRQNPTMFQLSSLAPNEAVWNQKRRNGKESA
jgi:hypothetical protein